MSISDVVRCLMEAAAQNPNRLDDVVEIRDLLEQPTEALLGDAPQVGRRSAIESCGVGDFGAVCRKRLRAASLPSRESFAQR